jgi:hypothetical protein
MTDFQNFTGWNAPYATTWLGLLQSEIGACVCGARVGCGTIGSYSLGSWGVVLNVVEFLYEAFFVCVC